MTVDDLVAGHDSPPAASLASGTTLADSTRGCRVFLRRHWAVLVPAFVYIYIFPYLPALRSPNELCRLLQSRALIDYHSIELGKEVQAHGWVGDLSCVAVARGRDHRVSNRLPCPQAPNNSQYSERHYYPSKAPLLSFAAAPVYGVLKLLHGDVSELALMFFARLWCVILPSIFLLVLVRRYLATVTTPDGADLVTAAYALGTLAFSYSELFVSHQTTAVLAFSCFYILWRVRRGEWSSRGYCLAGLLAGLTMTAEYTGALAVVPLAGYGLLTAPGGTRGKLRATALVALGFLPPVLALGAYHQAAFGHPLVSGYRFLEQVAYQGWHHGGFLGIKLPSGEAFIQSFFSPLRGLFTISPFMLLALPGLFDWRALRARDPELLLSLATFLVYTCFTSGFTYAAWGWTTGPRHLTPLVPFLLLPIARCLHPLFAHARADARPVGAWRAAAATGVALTLVNLAILTTSIMTMLNYISDTFTNALYQVALPFALRGYLPHNLLSLVGVPNPWAALPAVLAVLACAVACSVILIRRVAPGRRRLLASGVALGLAAAIVCLHASVRPSPARIVREQGAVSFMQGAYSPRPGHASPNLFAR
jgi:hypothetical protein